MNNIFCMEKYYIKGCPHRVSAAASSVRLDLIGMHCDAPLTLETQPPPPPPFSDVPMYSNKIQSDA